jgi:hypothetical protein
MWEDGIEEILSRREYIDSIKTYLNEEIGEGNVDYIIFTHKYPKPEDKKTGEKIVMTGLEESERFSSIKPSLEMIHEETVPEYFKRNIRGVSFTEENLSMANYGMSGNAAATAGGGHIVFRKPCESSDLGTVFNDVYLHEIAHCGDWINSKFLSLKERLELLKKVIMRVKSDNRYKSGYVEAIRNRLNKKDELSLKSREYFAEIVMAHLMGQPLPKEDTEIVNWMISKSYSNFDATKALERRNVIISQAIKEEAAKRHAIGIADIYTSYGYGSNYEYDNKIPENKVKKSKSKKKSGGRGAGF